MFYACISFAVPHTAGEDHELDVNVGSATVKQPLKLTVRQLASKFKQYTLITTMQCSGNRASEMIRSKGPTAFSNTPFQDIGMGKSSRVLLLRLKVIADCNGLK